MLADVDALVTLEEINVEIFEDLTKNVVRKGHCVFN
jgi:hypothetical protein